MIERRFFFVSPFPPEPGGISQSSAEIVAELRHHATLTVVGWGSHYPSFLYKGERSADPMGAESPDLSLQWFNPVSWIRAGIAARRTDHIFFAWVTPFDAVPYWVISAISRRTATAVVHNVTPHEPMPIQDTLTKLLFRRMNSFVAYSRSVRDDILAMIPTAIVTVVPLPSSIPLPAFAPPPPGPLSLLQPGYVRDYKGADIAVDAVAHATAEGVDVSLRIVGRFWDVSPDQLTNQAKSLGIADRVEVEDRYLTDEELAEAIGLAHAVLLPYRSATQSGIVPVALAHGRPIVATAVGGLPEQLNDGVNSVLAMEPTGESVGDAIVTLAASYDRFLRGTMTVQPSWQAVADALRDIAKGSAAAE